MAEAQAKSSIKNLHIAPRKVRLVADLIRGMQATEALGQLEVMTARSTEPLSKLIKSAIANAEAQKMDPTKLVIQTITVDQGPVYKRGLPKARGRATIIRKRMSHVNLGLAEKANVKAPKFVIPKKQKKVKESRRSKERTQKPRGDQEEVGRKARGGFTQKMFRRKSV